MNSNIQLDLLKSKVVNRQAMHRYAHLTTEQLLVEYYQITDDNFKDIFEDIFDELDRRLGNPKITNERLDAISNVMRMMS